MSISVRQKPTYQLFMLMLAPLFLLCHFVAGAATLNLAGNTSSLSLSSQFEVFEDKTAALDINDILAPVVSSAFRPLSGNLNASYTDSAYWLKFNIKRHDEHAPQRWLLEVAPSMLDDIRLFQIKPDGSIETQQAGDRLPFSQQAMQYRNPLFQLSLTDTSPQVIYLRIHTSSSLFVQATLWNTKAFSEQSNQTSVLLGVFYGAMLAMIAYNFFLLLSFRDTAMVHYLLLSGATLLAALSLNGHIALFFAPDWPWLVDILPGLSVTFILLNASLFISTFLQLKQKMPRMYQVFRLIQFLALIAMVLVLAGYNHQVASVIQSIGLLQILLILPTSVISGWRGYRPGYLVAIAYVGWSLGTILVVLRNLGVLEPSWMTSYGFQIGSILEVVLLALALADRINVIKRERVATQVQLLVLSQRAEQQLEAKVALRTTELAQAISSLRQLNNEKNEFLGIAAHDLKNPLTSMIGMTELLLNVEPQLPAAQQRHCLERISKNGHRMMHIISNLLEVNALEGGYTQFALKTLNLTELLAYVAEDYEDSANAKNIRLQLGSTAPVWVVADREVLFQVLDNLVSNAVKYSPRGKTIWLSTGADHGDGYCQVRDEGAGLSDADQEHLFERFVRLSSQPTAGEHSSGLGLSIAKKLAEAMHGSIRCDSRLGAGSSFIVNLPLAK
ncbi:hybrid sensor histidine kinase/response regulator LadS [soil metagenome]